MAEIPRALEAPMRDLAAGELRVMELARTGERLCSRPAPGKWSAIECIAHLVRANSMLADSIEQALKDAPLAQEPDAVRPGMLWRFLLRLIEPQVRLRGFAPARLQPPDDLEPTRILSDYRATHKRLHALAERCVRRDVNRLRLHHPVIGLGMSVGVAFLLIAAHERRHLAQAERATSF